MRLVLMCEILGFLPLVALLRFALSRHWLTQNRWALIIATYVSALAGTASLYYSTTPEGQFPPATRDWGVTIFVSLLLWIIDYPIARWVYRVMVRREQSD